jgi:hypothetical protein
VGRASVKEKVSREMPQKSKRLIDVIAKPCEYNTGVPNLAQNEVSKTKTADNTKEITFSYSFFISSSMI